MSSSETTQQFSAASLMDNSKQLSAMSLIPNNNTQDSDLGELLRSAVGDLSPENNRLTMYVPGNNGRGIGVRGSKKLIENEDAKEAVEKQLTLTDYHLRGGSVRFTCANSTATATGCTVDMVAIIPKIDNGLYYPRVQFFIKRLDYTLRMELTINPNAADQVWCAMDSIHKTLKGAETEFVINQESLGCRVDSLAVQISDQYTDSRVQIFSLTLGDGIVMKIIIFGGAHFVISIDGFTGNSSPRIYATEDGDSGDADISGYLNRRGKAMYSTEVSEVGDNYAGKNFNKMVFLGVLREMSMSVIKINRMKLPNHASGRLNNGVNILFIGKSHLPPGYLKSDNYAVMVFVWADYSSKPLLVEVELLEIRPKNSKNRSYMSNNITILGEINDSEINGVLTARFCPNGRELLSFTSPLVCRGDSCSAIATYPFEKDGQYCHVCKVARTSK